MNWRELPDRELLDLCLQKDQEAWIEFVRRFQRLIASVIYKTLSRPPRSLVDDLVQDTFIKICADDFSALKRFSWPHENALHGFLRVVASRVAHDQRRKGGAEKRGSGKGEVSLDEAREAVIPDLRPHAESELLLQKIIKILEKLLGSEPNFKRDQAMFLLYFRDGYTAKQISSLYHLTVKAVENILARMARLVRNYLKGDGASSGS